MYLIRLIPILASLLSYAILGNYSLTFVLFTILLFNVGNFINRIDIKFPEDEAAPFFQISLNKVAIGLLSITAFIGIILLFCAEDFEKTANFIWAYLNVISGYFYRELA